MYLGCDSLSALSRSRRIGVRCHVHRTRLIYILLLGKTSFDREDSLQPRLIEHTIYLEMRDQKQKTGVCADRKPFVCVCVCVPRFTLSRSVVLTDEPTTVGSGCSRVARRLLYSCIKSDLAKCNGCAFSSVATTPSYLALVASNQSSPSAMFVAASSHSNPRANERDQIIRSLLRISPRGPWASEARRCKLRPQAKCSGRWEKPRSVSKCGLPLML